MKKGKFLAVLVMVMTMVIGLSGCGSSGGNSLSDDKLRMSLEEGYLAETRGVEERYMSTITSDGLQEGMTEVEVSLYQAIDEDGNPYGDAKADLREIPVPEWYMNLCKEGRDRGMQVQCKLGNTINNKFDVTSREFIEADGNLLLLPDNRGGKKPIEDLGQ